MGSSGLMTRLVAVAFLIVIGMGVYTFMVKQDVEAADAKRVAAEKELATYKTRSAQYVTENKNVTTDRDQCRAEVTNLQAQLEAATAKKPAAPARR